MTWATDRLDALKAGTANPPPIVETLRLGLIDDWGEGWARKTWRPVPELATADGSLFGGYLAALADQILAFAAMTVVPGTRRSYACRRSRAASVGRSGAAVVCRKCTANATASA